MIIAGGPVKDHKLYIWTLSDVHWGANDCDTEKFLRYIAWAKQTPNLKIILMGDLMENAIPTHIPEASFEQAKQPKTQLDELVEILMPLKSKVIAIITGNHELRTFYKTNFDPSEMLAMQLNIPHTYKKYGGYLYIQVGKQKYTFAIHHGASASLNNMELDLRKLQKIYPGAHVYCVGHNHALGGRRYVVRDPDPKGVLSYIEREIIYVRTGSFLKYAAYAERKLYEPQRTGSAIVKLYDDNFVIGVDDSDKIGQNFTR